MANTNWSITQSGRYEPFELQVSRGQILGHTAVTVFGYNADVDQTLETLWPQGGVITYPAAATVIKVSSSSANDTAAGTGARTVLLEGLDGSFNEVSETVTLNGQTAVNTVNSYLFINNATVITAGSGLAAAGTIYFGVGVVTAGVPATVYASIVDGDNRSIAASYTVPGGHTGYVLSAGITAGQPTGSTSVTGKIIFRDAVTGIRTTQAVSTINNGSAIYDFASLLAVPEKTTIEGAAVGSADNNLVSSYFNMIIVQDPVS